MTIEVKEGETNREKRMIRKVKRGRRRGGGCRREGEKGRKERKEEQRKVERE